MLHFLWLRFQSKCIPPSPHLLPSFYSWARLFQHLNSRTIYISFFIFRFYTASVRCFLKGFLVLLMCPFLSFIIPCSSGYPRKLNCSLHFSFPIHFSKKKWIFCWVVVHTHHTRIRLLSLLLTTPLCSLVHILTSFSVYLIVKVVVSTSLVCFLPLSTSPGSRMTKSITVESVSDSPPHLLLVFSHVCQELRISTTVSTLLSTQLRIPKPLGHGIS